MTTEMRHCTALELQSYFLGVIPEETACELERHLGECPDCLARAGRISESLIRLDEWFDSRERSAHSRRIAGALERVERSAGLAGETRLRLGRWKHSLRRMPPARHRPAGPPLGYTVAAAIRGRRTAVRTRGVASTRPAREAETWTLGSSPAQVVLERPGDLKVCVEEPPEGRTLVLLAPLAGEAEARLEELQRAGPGAGHWLACFKDVPPGEYLLVLEPAAGEEP